MTNPRQNNNNDNLCANDAFTFALAALTVGRRVSPVAGQTAANGSSLGHSALSVGTARAWRTRIRVPARVRRRVVNDHTCKRTNLITIYVCCIILSFIIECGDGGGNPHKKFLVAIVYNFIGCRLKLYNSPDDRRTSLIIIIYFYSC